MRTGRFDVVLRSVADIPLAFYGYAFQKAWISIESVPSTALVPGPDLIPGGILNALVAIVPGILALKFNSHRFRRVLLYVGTGLQLAMRRCSSPCPSSTTLLRCSPLRQR